MTKERQAKIVKLAQHRDFDFAPDLREAIRELLAELEKYDLLRTAAKDIIDVWADHGRPRQHFVWLNEKAAHQFDKLEATIKRLDI